MGYSGDAGGLLDADTNMTYAVRYLAGAYRAAGGNQEQAIRNYQRGYYDKAKAQGFSPYAVASVQPQAAAPDPTMLRQQQELERRNAAEQQRLERHAMLDARISQQKAAEQTRIAEPSGDVAGSRRAAEGGGAGASRAASGHGAGADRPAACASTADCRAAQRGRAEAGRAAPGGSATEDRPRAGDTTAAHRTRAGKTEGSDRSRASSRGSRRRLSLQRSRSQPRRSARPLRVTPGTIRCATSSIRRTSRTRCRAIARRSLCKTVPRGAAIRAPARSRRAGAASGA